MKNRKLLRLFLVLILSTLPLWGQTSKDESFEEVGIDIILKELGQHTEANFIYKEGIFYIPLDELFALYAIKADFLLLQERIEGFFPTPDSPYTIDAQYKTYTIGERKGTFPGNAFLFHEEKFFATPDVLNEIFGFEIVVDFNALALFNHHESDIPAVRIKHLQDKISQSVTKKEKERIVLKSDKTHPLPRSNFRAGTGGIDLSATTNQDGDIAQYTLFGGFELLHGDMDIVISGSDEAQPKNIKEFPWRYSYAEPNSTMVNNVQLGYISGDTIDKATYYGAKVSNMLFTYAESFTNKRLAEYYLPGYTIELYINNAFVASTVTDAQGFYAFDIPVNYGTSFVELRFYGPYGEQFTKSFVYDVRDNFIKQKQFLYSLSAGEGAQEDIQYLELDTRYGLTDSLTIRMGEKLTRQLGNDENSTEEPYVALSYWAMENLITSIESIKDSYNRATLSLLYPSSGLLLNHTEYTDEGTLKKNSEIRVHGTLVDVVPVTLLYSKKEYETTDSDDYRLSLSYQAPFRLNSTLIANFYDWKHEETRYYETLLNMTYPLFAYPIHYLNGASLNLQLNYLDEEINTLKFGIKNNFTRSSSYTVDYLKEYLLIEKETFSLGVKRNLGNYFVTFSCNADTKDNYSANLGIGTYWGYNDRTQEVLRYHENNHNKSGVTVISFHDTNANHTLDDGEEVLKDAQVYLNGSPRRDEDVVDSRGFFNSLNAIAYRENTIESKPYVTPAGLYAPIYPRISFFPRPNLYQSICNPYVKSSNIYGTVYNEQNHPQSGIRISLINFATNEEKDVVSDLDGEFYFEGIMPGNYLLTVNQVFAQKNNIDIGEGTRTVKLLGGEEIDEVELHVTLP